MVRARWGRIDWLHGKSEKFQVWKNWCKSCLLYHLVIYVHWTIWKVPMPQVSLTIRSWNSDLEIIYGCIWKISSNCQHFTFQWPWWKHLAKMCYETKKKLSCLYCLFFIRAPLYSLYLSICQSDLFVLSIFSIPLAKI